MLGSGAFSFETPNVIDPGDLPPSAPPRNNKKSSSGSANSSTYSNSSNDSSNSDDEEYQLERESSARLLSDINDLDLSPPDQPYDPYQDDDDDDDNAEDEEYGHVAHHHHHHVARNYAANMLSISERGSKESIPLNKQFQRTVKLPTQSKHLVRNRILRLACRGFLVVLAVVLIIIIGGAIIDRRQAARDGDDPTQKFSWQTVRQYDLTKFLVHHGVSRASDLTTPGTPQYMASSWLADQDGLQLPIPASSSSGDVASEVSTTTTAAATAAAATPSDTYGLVQRYVLAMFFFALQGERWTQSVQFLSEQHECGWFQSTHFDDFIGHEYAVGVTCNAALQVTSLFMPRNNLQGSVLPTELQHLGQLELLALPDNDISGSIPSEFAKLQRLSFLDLKYNQITGTIPAWLGDVPDLQVLGLSNNLLMGSLPANLASLARLKTLAVDDNALTGSLDVLNQLTNLEYGWMDRNQFTGPLTADFTSRLERLRQLDLSGNLLRGNELPQHWFAHPTLHVLDLASNQLTATFPTELADHSELDYLSLRDNQIVGSIPDTIRRLSTLQHLDLRNNSLTGSLPVDFGKLSQLTYLDLGWNEWTPAQLPAFFVALVNLRELTLAATQLTGAVPAWVGEYLPQLVLLDLSHNQLRGGIPHELFDQVPRLDYLLLNHNQLTGTLPAGTTATKFKLLAVHGNRQGLKGNLTCPTTGYDGGNLVLTDCSVDCVGGCCPRCCQPAGDNDDREEKCFDQVLADLLTEQEGLWEFGYQRTPFGFDPDILDESGLFAVIEEQQP